MHNLEDGRKVQEKAVALFWLQVGAPARKAEGKSQEHVGLMRFIAVLG